MAAAPPAQEIRLLQWIGSEINATLELEEILATVLRAMDELFGFRHSLILLLDDSGDGLIVAASRGYERAVVGAKVPLGTGPIGVAARRRKIVRIANLGVQRSYLSSIRAQMELAGRAGELEQEPRLPVLPDAESQIAIPLQVKDALIGIFFVETAERRPFGEREESLVTIVANHAAASIHNARLYRLEAERRAELARANESLERLTLVLEERVRERTGELERKHRELQQTQAQLLQSAKMAALGDLVAGIAHDMNTPLGAILANADLVERAARILRESFPEASPGSPASKALEALDQSGRTTKVASQRILGLVTSLRRFARLDEAERKKADLHQGIEANLELLHHRLIENITLVRDFGELPEIVCAPHQLNQVFMNLLVNAIEAMPEGGTLTIRTGRRGEEAVLEFQDTGAGIEPWALERIFDPGFTTKGVGVGLGLGLAISYRIVQEHGGRLVVESRPGEGSRFTVLLPIRSV